MARINLLPWREELRKQQQQQFYKHLGFGFVVAIGVIIGAHMYEQSLIDDQETRNQYLKQTIANLDKKVTEIKKLKELRADLVARMEIIQQLQDTRGNIVHLFDQLARTVPEGIVLTNVSLKQGKTLEINGVSDSAARVADYLRNINNSPWFSNASIVGSGILAKDLDKQAPKAGGDPSVAYRGGYAFHIVAQFSPPKPDAEFDPQAAKEANKP